MLRAGLSLASDAPVRSTWIDLGVIATRQYGPEAFIEAGRRLTQRTSFYARGFVRPGDGGAMAGVRWEL